jgi:hypothetical protein
MHRFASGVLVATGVLLAAAASSSAGAATPPLAPWTQSAYNGAQSRANLTEATLTTSTVNKVHYLRSITAAPEGPNNACYTGVQSPVMTGGMIYQIEAGSLTARSAATGVEQWAAPPFDLQGEQYSLAVTNGIVIVGYTDCTSDSATFGYVEAYNATTGALKWRHPLAGWLSPIVVSGSYVVDDYADEGMGPDTITALRISDGTVAWSDQTCAGNRHVVIVDQNVIYRCITNNGAGADTVQARTLASGAKVWSAPGGVVQRGDTDATTGHHVYIKRSGGVDDVNPSTGARRFTLAGATDVLAVDKTRAYATCPAGLCAYTVATGARAWAVPVPDPAADISTAAEAAGVLYLGNGDLLNAASGGFIRNLFPGNGRAQVIIGDGRIGAADNERILDLYGLSGA